MEEWQEAMESEIARTGHQRYRQLCAGEHPDHQAWRARMVQKRPSGGEYPSPAVQAANLAGAVVRAVRSAARGKPVLVPGAVYQERLAICRQCPEYDRERSRCRQCGCTTAKLTLAAERCPLEPPRWGAVIRESGPDLDGEPAAG